MIGPTVCPKGWYQDQTGQQVCKACPAGSYWDRQGLTAVSGTCPAGFYCLANQVNFQANMCAIGYYWTAGSSSTTSCPQGSYWDRSMLGIAGTNWWAGYYWNQLQITSPNPSGSTCTRGYYCGAGTINPTASEIHFIFWIFIFKAKIFLLYIFIFFIKFLLLLFFDRNIFYEYIYH